MRFLSFLLLTLLCLPAAKAEQPDTTAVTMNYSVQNLIPGVWASFNVTGAIPGEVVLICYSVRGAGPTPTRFGVLDMSHPIYQLSFNIADNNGDVVFNFFTPSTAAGRTVYTQCIAPSSNNLSNSLAIAVP